MQKDAELREELKLLEQIDEINQQYSSGDEKKKRKKPRKESPAPQVEQAA
jgi:hypothetical protein